jgi:hypothetical protein
MSTIKANAILDASGGNTVTINSVTPTAYNTMGKNRIINGAMEIDQRNAGASVSTSSGSAVYTLDRWNALYSQTNKFTVQQNAGSVTSAVGFKNYLGATSSSAYSVGATDFFSIRQLFEGFNTSDLEWGTANAKTVTVSFKVYSSLTGTFGGAIQNHNGTRSYPFSYTISSANTWTDINVTIAGDTSGSWNGATNGIGLQVMFSLGAGSTYSGTAGSWSTTQYFTSTGATSVVGTNGATFYITGVQLEVGSVATEFERRPYGTELALCQRYFWKASDYNRNSGVEPICNIVFSSGTDLRGIIMFPVEMRATPSLVSSSGANYFRVYNGSSFAFTAVGTDFGSKYGFCFGSCTGISGATGGQGGILFTNAPGGSLAFSSEL